MVARSSSFSLVLLALGLSVVACPTSAQQPASALSFKIIIPPHCFELSEAARQDALLVAALLSKRLLCAERTGAGTPQHLELTKEGLRVTPGEPNALHRGGA